MNKPAFLPIVSGSALLVLLVAGTGCGTGSVPRDLMAEEVNSNNPTERPVAMRGETTFSDGKIAAFATISRGFDRGVRSGGGRGKGGTGDGEGRRGRGRDSDNGFTESYPVSFGDSEEDQKAAMEEYVRQAKARRAAGSPMPPVTLRVLFENRGTEPVELEVTEVNSDLGNFAVRPPKLTLAPGDKGTLEPMISQLGVTSDEIPLKVAVRIGSKKETQIVAVKNVIAPALRK